MKMPPKETPWGQWDSIREVIPGVWRVSTAGHGGYWVAPDRLAKMPAVLVVGPADAPGEKPFSVDDQRAGWFEEDQEAGRVVVAFCVGADAPAFGPKATDMYTRALDGLRRDCPVTVAKLTADGYFNRHAPKAGNPAISMTGAE